MGRSSYIIYVKFKLQKRQELKVSDRALKTEHWTEDDEAGKISKLYTVQSACPTHGRPTQPQHCLSTTCKYDVSIVLGSSQHSDSETFYINYGRLPCIAILIHSVSRLI